jgi:hypothetical protein
MSEHAIQYSTYLVQRHSFQQQALAARVSAGQQPDFRLGETEPFGKKTAKLLIGGILGRFGRKTDLERIAVPSHKSRDRRVREGVDQQNGPLVRFIGRSLRSWCN